MTSRTPPKTAIENYYNPFSIDYPSTSRGKKKKQSKRSNANAKQRSDRALFIHAQPVPIELLITVISIITNYISYALENVCLTFSQNKHNEMCRRGADRVVPYFASVIHSHCTTGYLNKSSNAYKTRYKNRLMKNEKRDRWRRRRRRRRR